GGGPLHGVVPVVRLVPERVELALRLVAAARVLEDDDVAVRREYYARVRRGAVVGRALQEDGELSGRVGPVHVRDELHAVAHRDLDPALDRHPMLAEGRRGPGRGRTAPEHDDRRRPPQATYRQRAPLHRSDLRSLTTRSPSLASAARLR